MPTYCTLTESEEKTGDRGKSEPSPRIPVGNGDWEGNAPPREPSSCSPTSRLGHAFATRARSGSPRQEPRSRAKSLCTAQSAGRSSRDRESGTAQCCPGSPGQFHSPVNPNGAGGSARFALEVAIFARRKWVVSASDSGLLQRVLGAEAFVQAPPQWSSRTPVSPKRSPARPSGVAVEREGAGSVAPFANGTRRLTVPRFACLLSGQPRGLQCKACTGLQPWTCRFLLLGGRGRHFGP